MHRRRFLRRSVTSVAATLGLSAWGCAPKTPASGEFAGQELRIFVYAGGHEQTMREVFVPRFEADTGATVLLQPGWWDGIAKLKASPAEDPPFDLLISDATQGFPAAREGLFARLDLERLPNVRLLVPTAVDHWLFRERYGIPYPDAVMTLAYNRDLYQVTDTGWKTLLDPRLRGKIGLYRSFYMSLYTFACIWAEVEGQPGTAQRRIRQQLDEVLRFAREHRDRVALWWPTSAEMILSLARQELWAGNMHSPEYLAAMREQPALAAVVPTHDRAFVQVFWAIAAGSRRQALAHAAINTIFSPEIQLGFARRGSATALLQVAAQMAQEDARWKQLYPHTEAQFQTLQYYPYDVYAEHWDQIAEQWDRDILRSR